MNRSYYDHNGRKQKRVSSDSVWPLRSSNGRPFHDRNYVPPNEAKLLEEKSSEKRPILVAHS